MPQRIHNEPALARRRYDLLVARSAHRTFSARTWYGMAVRLFKASRTVTGERAKVLWDRGLDCERRGERVIAQGLARARHAVRVAIPMLREERAA